MSFEHRGDLPPPADVIRLRGLTKRFDTRSVLEQLDWNVPAGRVVGLLGRNGAGKSTLIRCLLGLTPLDAGDIEIFGERYTGPAGERMHRIGYVPQTFDLFPWMKVRAFLDFTAAFYARWDRDLVERLLGRWELDPKQKIGQLSQGQRQRLAIVRAIAPDPELLILDEPVASLDPQARREFLAELLALTRRPGKTVVFSTHITGDLERADADIALLRRGRIQFTRTLADLKQNLRQVTLTRPDGWAQPPPFAWALQRQVEGASLHLLVDGASAEALHDLAARTNATLAVHTPTLEDVFVALA